MTMKTIKLRPVDCCAVPTEAPPLGEEERVQIVSVFRALGDPTRLDIFRLVAAQTEPICVCDIVERFDVSQPTISHHLKVLRDAGLVTVSRRGIWAYYAAAPQGLELLHQLGTHLKLREVAAVS
jgi:ArsR family transcriptional regulator, arsenate/arsenite/antimonite-responsive transcriptional repressor